jgi:AcrR family transcriptional regulator
MPSQPPEPEPAKSPAAHGGDRELRADARRNRERVLRTAQQMFAAEGLGVSLDEIARRAGVGPGTVHRHFPAKEALYLAVSLDQIEQLAAEAEVLAATGDPATALFTQLSRMMASGAENVAVKSALMAAEFDLRAAAPDIAAALSRHVADLLDRAKAVRAVRDDVTLEEVMALVAGAFAAIRHAGVETSRQRSGHIAQLILDGLRPQPRSATPERSPTLPSRTPRPHKSADAIDERMLAGFSLADRQQLEVALSACVNALTRG